jgi:hypothetical protein
LIEPISEAFNPHCPSKARLGLATLSRSMLSRVEFILTASRSLSKDPNSLSQKSKLLQRNLLREEVGARGIRRTISSRERPISERSETRGAKVCSTSVQRMTGSMATTAAMPAAGTPRVPPRKASTASGLERELAANAVSPGGTRLAWSLAAYSYLGYV